MPSQAKKVLLIGLDAPIAHRIFDLAQAGELPEFKKLIDNGVWAKNCLVPLPTVTPPNWTTIATGAWPGTHGITSFHTHMPGDPFLEELQSWDFDQCQSETIWEAASRAGKRSIVINYPSTDGLTPKDGIRLGGASMFMNSFRTGITGRGGPIGLAADQVFSTDEYLIGGTEIKLRPATGWSNLADGAKALEAELPLKYRSPRFSMKPKVWYMLVIADESQGYNRVLLSEFKDVEAAFADLALGEWTDNILQEFETETGPQRAAFCCKLTELSENARDLRLYVTDLCGLEGWSVPEEIAGEIPWQEGLPISVYPAFAWGAGWIDTETFIEVYDMEHRWLANATTYLAQHKPWDILSVVIHGPDTFHHCLANLVDPAFCPEPDRLPFYQDIERRYYQHVDHAVGRIAALADDETVTVLVSDHGTKATTRRFIPARVMADAGLTVFQDPLPAMKDNVPATKDEVLDQRMPFHAPPPDWSRTKAIMVGECYIWVNLKGRDPDGIVEPEDYESVRDEIIRALYDYTDPETGMKPVMLAIRREDALVFGLYGKMGERVGDIVYAINPQYGRQHGPAWPTHEIGIGSMRGLFLMAGPGVKKGEVLERRVDLVDLVPTLCHLAELPVPKDAEGGIIYQALEDPDAKSTELQRARDNFRRLKAIYEAQQAESHTYNT